MKKVLMISVFVLGILSLTGCNDNSIRVYTIPREVASPNVALTVTESEPALSGISWTVPSGWIKEEASGFRQGSFLIRQSNGRQAEVTVVMLSGNAGGLLANINRWRGQIGLQAVTETDLPRIVTAQTLNGMEFRIVNFAGQVNSVKTRIVAATLNRGNDTWFFKMMGHDQVVTQSMPEFTQFLKSISFNGGS